MEEDKLSLKKDVEKEAKLSLKNDVEKNVMEIENGMATFSIIGEGCQERKSRSYVSWDDYFMAVSFLTAMRSKDPATQVGACIVSQEKKIVGIGYNGMPSGCKDDELPWAKESSDPLHTKYMYVCHAELNAIMNKNSADLKGCKIYVALFPCNECGKLIIQAGIREVIYFSDKHSHKPETIASKLLMDLAGVKYRKHNPSQQKINLVFRNIDKNWSAPSSQNGSRTISSPTEHCRDINKARSDYLAWGEYFMAMAFLSALRSKDPSTQVGACIVNKKNKIVGIGYNGMPLGCCDNLLPWGKTSKNRLQTKYMYVCHAEMNAVMNKNCADVADCCIYVALFPCNECTKIIIQAGIKEIVYYSDKYSDQTPFIASKKMLDLAGVSYRQYGWPCQNVVIDFTAIDWNKNSQLPTTPKKTL